MPTATVRPKLHANKRARSDRKKRAASAEKTRHHGIEVNESLVWQGWQPGREYTKQIVLKNVKVKTEKIKYKVPNSRFFTTLYPKAVVLSAGTSFSLPVTFRPLEKIVYEDVIEFETKEGGFSIPIKAVLPEVEIDIPDDLTFDMCAAEDYVQQSFDIKNTGDLPLTFNWDVAGPFFIEPSEATLAPKSSYSLVATFKPKGANVYDAEAVCQYGPNFSHHKVMKLYGTGKYPHILVYSGGKPVTSEAGCGSAVNFGTIPLGKTLEKNVELKNISPVRAPFRVDHSTDDSRFDTAFSCPQLHGIIPPLGTLNLPITYSPTSADSKTTEYFSIIPIGNVSKSVIKCVGASTGPSMEFSCNLINFMQINIGETATRTLNISNNLEVPATFQFVIDCNESTFKFEQTSGVLQPNSKKTLIIEFSPQYPINYYRRITCLIHNQAPLFLDLLGTCHSEQIKPSVLQAKHVENYYKHVERGLSVFPPEKLNELIHERKLEIDESGALMVPRLIPILDGETEDSNFQTVCAPMDSIPPMDQYFNDGYHSDVMYTIPHVTMDTDRANFGRAQNLRVIGDKVINLTNNTKGKISIQWVAGSNCTFSVSPATMDVPPLRSCSFRVSFKPNAPNQFYGAELECFVYYKSLRDYRLVEEVTHCPPWCLTLTCTGHTFMPNHETFLPRYTIDPSMLVFPAVNTYEATYRTVLLQNTGPTPIMYDIEADNTGIFSVKPCIGILREGSQIFVVKSLPTNVMIYKQVMRMRLNDAEIHTKELQLWSSAESAEVLLDNDGVMYFKPTCVGTASSRSYTVKNISRIPLRYEWKLHHKDGQLLKVEPQSGLIQPNEYMSQTWSFIPMSNEKYVMKAALIVWGQRVDSSGGKRRQFMVRAIGEGSIGEIKVEENYINYGDVVVGSAVKKDIILYNSGDCNLHFKLDVEQSIDSPYPGENYVSEPLALHLGVTDGVLPARSKIIVTATVRPVRRVTYQFAVSYQLLKPEDNLAHDIAFEPQHLCHILVSGVFPAMAVTDARCSGSAAGISKKQLWNLFSLDNLNVCLDADPTSDELRYSVGTRHSYQKRAPVMTRAILDVNFSAAPLNSEQCVVSLLFENTGTVSTEWAFLFPRDLQLELDYWAESGEFDDDELHEMKVMDNDLFTVEPRKGRLNPGESKVLTFTYSHIMAGTDRLPVLLKLSQGREILLNFIGVTVDPERHYIHFPANKHQFSPVPIGEKISPIQIYELYNGGAQPVQYEFNLSPLDIIEQENFEQAIFECLNPVGEVQPGKTAQIEWRFSPVEAKTYMVDVPVTVSNGDTAIITFTGVGYDKRALGDTMPITDQGSMSGVPSVQSVPIPGQLVYLSQERISFGNLPLFSQARRMIFISNRSKEHNVSFEWHVTSQLDSQYMSLQPTRGQIEPGGSQLCRVTFTACGLPSFYDLDLVCEITDETEMATYTAALSDWMEEQKRQKYEFTITEHDLDADKRLEEDPELVEAPRIDADFSKYKTLPPIKAPTADDRKMMRKCRRKRDEDLWERPIPPPPFLLHLGITARTHDIHEFQNSFPEEYRNYFINRSLSEGPTGKSDADVSDLSVPDVIQCTEAESELVSGVLNNVLRNLMDDVYFHEAIKKTSKEPIPYYCQYGDKLLSTALSTTSIATLSTPEPPCIPDIRTSSPVEGVVHEHPSKPTSSAISSRSNTPASPTTKKPRPPSKKDMKIAFEQEQRMSQKQNLKKLSEFGNFLEDCMENALLNIMSESLSGEFNITARSRFVALPKRGNSATNRILDR